MMHGLANPKLKKKISKSTLCGQGAQPNTTQKYVLLLPTSLIYLTKQQ